MQVLRYVLCDVFTDTPLSGNPLAVFTDARGVAAERMRALARELNLSETAFVVPASRPGAQAGLRIFTPARELRFAGHPVLGSAIVLGQPLQRDELLLETAAGVVSVRLLREGGRVTAGWMTQPLPTRAAFTPESAVLTALGLSGSRAPIALYDNGVRHVFVVAPSVKAVSELRPHQAALAALPADAFNVCAPEGARWKTRMFAPALGIAEDAATGGAAGPLAAHLAHSGLTSFGVELVIEQGAELGRPSVLRAVARGSRERLEAIEVGGNAVIIGRGEVRLP